MYGQFSFYWIVINLSPCGWCGTFSMLQPQVTPPTAIRIKKRCSGFYWFMWRLPPLSVCLSICLSTRQTDSQSVLSVRQCIIAWGIFCETVYESVSLSVWEGGRGRRRDRWCVWPNSIRNSISCLLDTLWQIAVQFGWSATMIIVALDQEDEGKDHDHAAVVRPLAEQGIPDRVQRHTDSHDSRPNIKYTMCVWENLPAMNRMGIGVLMPSGVKPVSLLAPSKRAVKAIWRVRLYSRKERQLSHTYPVERLVGSVTVDVASYWPSYTLSFLKRNTVFSDFKIDLRLKIISICA